LWATRPKSPRSIKVLQEYAKEATVTDRRARGFRVQKEIVQQNGTVELHFVQ
jgi:hypothetical protein